MCRSAPYRTRATLIGVGLIGGLVAVDVVPAQLAPATATLDEEFTRILSVRELSDGRVLVSDQREKRVVVADFQSGAVRMIGRVGKGPGEFEEPGAFFALAGDSSIMQDSGNRLRWFLLRGDSIVGTLPPDDPAIRAGGGSLGGADARGAILARRPGPPVEIGGGRRRVLSHVMRVDRSSGRSETLATAAGLTLESRQTGAPPQQTIRTWQVVFTVAEQSAMSTDGWVAIARTDPYRVDWHPPSGTPVLGAPIPWTPVRVTAEEKQFWHDDTLEEAGSDRPFDFSIVPFAEAIAPFRNAALMPTPEGALLVLRERSSAAPGHDYDVIDRRGSRVRTIRLPPSERIVGFGAGTVYVAAKDDDGIERLRRHAWPGTAAR